MIRSKFLSFFIFCVLINAPMFATGNDIYSDVSLDVEPLDGVFLEQYTKFLPIFVASDTPFDDGEIVHIEVSVTDIKIPFRFRLSFDKEYNQYYEGGTTYSSDRKTYTSPYMHENSKITFDLNWTAYLSGAHNITEIDEIPFLGYGYVDSLGIQFETLVGEWNYSLNAEIITTTGMQPIDGNFVTDETGIIPYQENISSVSSQSIETSDTGLLLIPSFVVIASLLIIPSIVRNFFRRAEL